MRIIPPFLYLALKYIEMKGDDFSDKGTVKKMKMEKSV